MAVPAGAITLEKGSRSEHVLTLQEQLRSLGYLKAGSTGYFGSATKAAVQTFQTNAGLSATGVADDATIAELNRAAAPEQDVLEQLARVIYAEARGESFAGQVAIGAVVLNRVQSDAFPDSITDVIFQPGQFTCIQDGQYDLTPDATAFEAAKAALNGDDPTNGALYYYNPRLATSSWSKSRPIQVRIDRHVFTN
ncbi:cell wall hydrolase [Paenibacillus sp. GYB003]